MKLTTDYLKNVMPEPRVDRLEVRDDLEPGLIFRVTATGRRAWSVRYVNEAGDHRRKALGPFPSIGLARAREEARKVKGLVASGNDLVETEREAKAAARRAKLNSVGALADSYYADAALGLHRPNARSAKRESTITEERRVYERLVAPKFGDTPMTALRRADIQEFVTSVSKKSPSNGRTCRAILRQLGNYARWREIIDVNPAQAIAVVPSESRERVMSDAEMRTIWQACKRPVESRLELSRQMALAVRLCMVTLQRAGEVVGARWSEVDRDRKVWIIPAARMKGKRTHVVPLSDMAVELFNEAERLIGGDVYVFASHRFADKPEVPMKATALSRAVTRMMATLGIEDASCHDFRRTGATNMTSERIGEPRLVVSRVIAHNTDTGGAAAVTSVYDQNDYLAEKRRALTAWAKLLGEIVDGPQKPGHPRPESNIIPFRRAG